MCDEKSEIFTRPCTGGPETSSQGTSLLNQSDASRDAFDGGLLGHGETIGSCHPMIAIPGIIVRSGDDLTMGLPGLTSCLRAGGIHLDLAPRGDCNGPASHAMHQPQETDRPGRSFGLPVAIRGPRLKRGAGHGKKSLRGVERRSTGVFLSSLRKLDKNVEYPVAIRLTSRSSAPGHRGCRRSRGRSCGWSRSSSRDRRWAGSRPGPASRRRPRNSTGPRTAGSGPSGRPAS